MNADFAALCARRLLHELAEASQLLGVRCRSLAGRNRHEHVQSVRGTLSRLFGSSMFTFFRAGGQVFGQERDDLPRLRQRLVLEREIRRLHRMRDRYVLFVDLSRCNVACLQAHSPTRRANRSAPTVSRARSRTSPGPRSASSAPLASTRSRSHNRAASLATLVRRLSVHSRW